MDLTESQKQHLDSNLSEALEEILQILKNSCANMVEYEIQFSHIYHHINCAFNGLGEADPYKFYEPGGNWDSMIRFPLELKKYGNVK